MLAGSNPHSSHLISFIPNKIGIVTNAMLCCPTPLHSLTHGVCHWTVVACGNCGRPCLPVALLPTQVQYLTMAGRLVVAPTQLPSHSESPDSAAQADENQITMKPLPLTPLELFLLQSATPQAPMVIQVVMRLTGECQPDLYVKTLQRSIERHPLLSCRIRMIDRKWHWISAPPEPVTVSRRPGSVFESETGPRTKSIDLMTSAGLHPSIVVLDDGVKVYLDLHHSVSDGNGLRQVITDWLHLYHCEVTGTRSKLSEIDPHRLTLRNVFPQPTSIAPVSAKQAIINFWSTIRGRTARWTSPTRNDRQSLNATHSHCVEIILSDSQGEQLRDRLAAWRVKLNELVMVCSMSTFAQLAPAGPMNHHVTVLNPIDLRLPSDRALSATNRFGIAFMRRPRQACLKPASILRGLHDEMSWVRTNCIGVEFIKGLAAAARIPGGINFFRRMGLLIPSIQWTCLGNVARGGKRLIPSVDGMPISGGLQLATVSGFAPFSEDVPVSIATCETNKTVTLTVRSSPRFLTMDQTQRFATMLVNELCQLDLPDESLLPAQNKNAPGIGVADEHASG